MKWSNLNTILGVLLIAAGMLFALQTFNALDRPDTLWSGLWAVVFAVGGVTFTWRFLTDRFVSWWAIIPGLTLLALSVLVGSASLGLETEDTWMGALFLGSIGLSFWIVYLVRREYWWAVIPGGVLVTLALVVLASQWLEGLPVASVLFFGLAVTFGLVSLIPMPDGHMVWPLIPAGVLALFGMALLFGFTSFLNYVWAVALIVIGLVMLYRQGGRGAMARRG